MTHTINHVRKFHKAFGHPVAEQINPGTKQLRALRVNLIAEELGELCAALGVALTLECNGVTHQLTVQALKDDNEVDLAETADALGDIDYVTQGANLVFGIPAERVMKEIHRANMSKLGADGKPIYREDGKITKGPSYAPPNVAAVLKSTAWVKRWRERLIIAAIWTVAAVVAVPCALFVVYVLILIRDAYW